MSFRVNAFPRVVRRTRGRVTCRPARGVTDTSDGRGEIGSTAWALAAVYRGWMTVVDLREHRADYGFDGDYRAVSAPTVAKIVGVASAGLLVASARSLVRGKPFAAAVTGGTGAGIAA